MCKCKLAPALIGNAEAMAFTEAEVVEPFAVNINSAFLVQYHLEADKELSQQRMALSHSLLKWCANYISEQRYVGRAACIRFFLFRCNSHHRLPPQEFAASKHLTYPSQMYS